KTFIASPPHRKCRCISVLSPWTLLPEQIHRRRRPEGFGVFRQSDRYRTGVRAGSQRTCRRVQEALVFWLFAPGRISTAVEGGVGKSNPARSEPRGSTPVDGIAQVASRLELGGRGGRL